ncbi:hypothetical protein LuPra_02796 [Luteitalea pratensis]|uniref:Uncharacterized protein n=1 Tax=Luteitalea pratensis TaxID=1855912 RepID=A0A143PLW6_LUTPR|nr:hypothetical protein [Luteitalea pratensis]AMY09577.1 hypothetical protein LuPra_02796 [Luteitalea pratensis]
MPAMHCRSVFGHAAASFEDVRASVGVPRTASVRQMADLYVREVVFDEPIVTSDGVALGGHHRVTIQRDGRYRYQGHFRATGFPSFDVAILTTVGYTIPIPGVPTPAAAQVAFAAQGRVHGTNEAGDREHTWDTEGVAPLLAAEWQGVRRGQLNRHLEFDTDWFGPAGDVVGFLAQVVALGATFGAAGVAIVIVGEAADLLDVEQIVLPGIVGVVFAGGAAYVLGPSALIPGFIVGAAVTAALITQRPIFPHEEAFAIEVFGPTLPFDRIRLTNLVGFGDRPFTAPGPGGVILVNLGKGFDNPTTYSGKGGDEEGLSAPGQLFIHELTHAWQIANESFTPEYYCRAVATSTGTLGGDMSTYGYGPAGPSWGSFGTEQQGSIVDQWFAGSTDPDERSQQQRPYRAKDDDEQGAAQNPYYRYIRDNIRARVA